ncbi:hypothetical protein [Pseudoalteromonas sp. S16_S37]|uniref:hypothetical protein n=1 Tax=Pseudoalteromonas sp. S16_S37 TaxID=2720228 RepID=UPI001680213E|nr:hypothetical protein [Pseudoalteromonas sp. S16_S37]MBD1583450.1 hypothetical protein [Pseudoalteromonas sp. S16_S37]
MNEFFYSAGWVLKVIELLIVLFWLYKFSKMKWKLFFGIKKDPFSVQRHELYSCFLTAFSFLIFHLIGSETEQLILSLQLDSNERIKLFYTTMIIVRFSFILTLVCLHLIRGCTFSATARICTYSSLVVMMLLGMELIARGYYDYHELSVIYVVGGWLCNFIAVGALCSYPIRSIKEYLKQRKTAVE